MEPPRGTKRAAGVEDVVRVSEEGRYNYGAAYDFVDDDAEGGGGGSSRDLAFLDESGSFVERAARGGTKEDAWLGTADADTAAPKATKRARKALRKQEEDERLLEDRAVFEIKKRMAGILRPGETVPRALRRLKGGGGGAYATGTGTRGSRMDEATRRAFDELTDAAADLMKRGDLEAYSDDREDFEHAAWVYEYRRRAAVSAAAEVEKEYQADRTAAAARNYVVDMFGDDVGACTKTAADSEAGGQAINPDQPADACDASAVEAAARGGTKEDAWLGTADADTAAPKATKRARKALRKQEEDERLLDDLVSSRAVFEIQKRIVGILWPLETVPRALRRLKSSGGDGDGVPTGIGTGTTRGDGGRMDEATRRAFDELTDAAAELLERGDLDAYSHDREAFEHAAWVYEYRRRRRAAASAAQEVEEKHQADMFGDNVDAGEQAVYPDQAAAAAEEEEEAGEGTGVAGWDYVYDTAAARGVTTMPRLGATAMLLRVHGSPTTTTTGNAPARAMRCRHRD